jgi:putative transcriptional regulator
MKTLALLLALASAIPAQDAAPGIGRFLIAKPQVEGFFAESVIVLVDHAETGSLGLIVNRPIGSSLAELVPELEAARGHHEPAFLGGPVATDQMLLLVRGASQPRGSAPVLERVFVSGSRETLQALLAKPPKGGELRAYVGYAGWAPGQLDAEIARGDWLVAPGDAASVFTHTPAALWKQLFDRHRTLEVNGPSPRRTHPAATCLAAGCGVRSRHRTLEVRAPPQVARTKKSINLSAPWRSAAASSDSPTSGRARSSTR